MKKISILSTALAFLLVGCGSSSNSNTSPTPTPSPKVGIFKDAPVDGLKYSSKTFDGFTQNGGKFNYLESESINFYIGNVLLGSSKGADIITPVDIVNGASDTTDIKVQNILRLLQSLDSDNNPDNGIMLPDSARNAYYSKSVDLESEAFLNDFITVINPNEILIDSDSAIEHFNKQNGIVSTPTPIPTASTLPSPQPTIEPSIEPTVEATTPPTLPATDSGVSNPTTTATLSFDPETGDFKNLGSSDVTINNMVVDFTGSYSVSGFTIPFTGSFDYESEIVSVTTNGVSTSTKTPQLEKIYPMTVKANEIIPIETFKYDVGVDGVSGNIDYTYTFKTSAGDIVEKASLKF